VRFADDFLILCADYTGSEGARGAVAQCLEGRGLRLSLSTTRGTHPRHADDGKGGGDFLGCTMRHFPAGKTRRGNKQHGQPRGHKTPSTPRKAALTTPSAAWHTLVKPPRAAPQAARIPARNRGIPGWASYDRTGGSSAVFTHGARHLYAQLRPWATFRHPNQGGGWIARREWRLHPRRDCIVTGGAHAGLRLRGPAEIPQRKHVTLRGSASVYEGPLVSWAARLKDQPLTGNLKGHRRARQQGRCPGCGLHFNEGDVLELDHLVPLATGGSAHRTNTQLLPRHCHDQKHGPRAVGDA
jgi:RNA-directed DNA polymerase